MKTTKVGFILVVLFLISTAKAQWTQVNQLSGIGNYPRISVVDSNVIWVIGGEKSVTTTNVIYRTVNGGLNWQTVPVTGLPYSLTLTAKDSVTAFVGDIGADPPGGGNAKLFKTTNAGLNWILIDSTGGTTGFFDDIAFSKSNPQYGFALGDSPFGMGSPFFIYKTTNGGLNWFRMSAPGISNTTGFYYSGFIIDEMFYGYLTNSTTGQTEPYITSDGGTTWFRNNSPVMATFSGDVVFSDNKQTGIYFTNNSLPTIRRTSNGGQIWEYIDCLMDISGNCHASWVTGTNTVFVCAGQSSSGNCVIRSDDGGLTWTGQNTPANRVMDIDYAKYNDRIVAYTVSHTTGVILKSRQDVTSVGINTTSSIVPQGYHLSQNYPNPFNPVTNINYDLPFAGEVSIKVYDIRGNEVATLVNQWQPAGSYSVDFDSQRKNLSSGEYFYRLKAAEFSEVKKMILIK